MLAAYRLSSDLNAREDDQKGRPIVSAHEFLLSDANDFDPEFLVQFSTDRISVRFPVLTFSAGKLPEATMPFLERTLTDQVLVAA